MGTDNSPKDKAGKEVALIAGPTASGKSDVAVELALRLHDRGRDAVIINADSMQVYADLQVVSARPTREEMRGIPHRLFGTWDGAQACSTADWAKAAKDEIAAAHVAGAVPILVGGTGLYLQTLLEGIAPIPEIAEDVRQRIRSASLEKVRAELAELDPVSLARIGASDTQRLCRALEVAASTGRTLGDWQQHKEGGIAQDIALHPLILLPDREWLYARCNERFRWMLDNGAVEEVEALMKRGLHPDLPVMRAIGVPEIATLDKQSRDAVEEAGGTATRQYAKRQYTWFRNQPPEWWPREREQSSPTQLVEHHFEILLQ
ncbi:tRNA (adenosine(37)-N6)-dimethylallyltransferase MiaA [Qipengyuania sp. DSG2-2]|uniref:tRNA (adenosine(37)-N6)-dimethylallyltransferase MiaA n=1 Tax=Qipengyuania sp. DGS2-2 TaxID=3349631 RepID=UPI0036D397AD